MIKGIIFDLDGVLVHTDEYHYQAWKKLADRLHIPFDRQVNHRLRGVSREQSLGIILEQYHGKPLSNQEKMELAQEKNQDYRKLLEKMTPEQVDPGVRTTLNELRRRGYKLAVGSSSKNTPVILERTGLKDFFDGVADGNCITRSKPDPEVFLKAAQLLKLDAKACAVVEDAAAGIQAACAGEMMPVGIGEAAGDSRAVIALERIEQLLDYFMG